MEIKNWIDAVHRNKHNMIPVVQLAISKPINALLIASNLTKDFPLNLLLEIEEKKKEADEIMSYLSSIGGIDTCEEDPVAKLKDQVNHVVEEIVPQIATFKTFFLQFKDKDYLFSTSESGKRALYLIKRAPSRCDLSYYGLLKIGTIDKKNDNVKSCQTFKLIEVLEDSFDALENFKVIYKCSNRDTEVYINKDDFQIEVLSNFVENIKRHAFPFNEYGNKLVVDKIVEVSVKNDENYVFIRISNNGCPYVGNIDNMFNPGYCAGKYGSTGYGLSSARQFLLSIGGNIEFEPIEEYVVSFLIKIPKIK